MVLNQSFIQTIDWPMVLNQSFIQTIDWSMVLCSLFVSGHIDVSRYGFFMCLFSKLFYLLLFHSSYLCFNNNKQIILHTFIILFYIIVTYIWGSDIERLFHTNTFTLFLLSI